MPEPRDKPAKKHRSEIGATGSPERKLGKQGVTGPRDSRGAATPPPGSLLAGTLALDVALGATILLVLQHLGAMRIPGCSPGGACDRAAASIWGKIPILEWPTSYVGAAYFTGLLFAWTVCRGSAPTAMRWVVRVGMVGSALLVAVMAAGSLMCAYCLVVHAAHAWFWLRCERSTRPARGSEVALVVGALAFALATVVVAMADQSFRASTLRRAEAELAASSAAAAARGAGNSNDAPGAPGSEFTGHDPTGPAGSRSHRGAPGPAFTGHDPIGPAGSRSHRGAPGPAFTGRYHWGPMPAPIRLVLFTDYQCPDCALMEGAVRALMASRSDVSVSIKHFPFCSDCNPNVTTDLHPRACEAAITAEAFGMLGGDAAFRRAHEWLFDHAGIADAQGTQLLARDLGLDPAALAAAITSGEPRRRVRADIDEAMGLGLHATPMVFINGVELRGWNAPDALRRAVETVAGARPPALGPEHDRPALALDKFIADWRAQPMRHLPPAGSSLVSGPSSAAVNVVLFGDYEEPFTAEADGIIRGIAGRRTDVAYRFRHFPVDRECNPFVTTTLHPHACRAARAAEGAGALAGVAGAWSMHTWLMAHQADLSDEAIARGAGELGLDAAALFAAADAASVREAVAQDERAANQLGITGIPMIFVDGRFVPRWRLDGPRVLEAIIDEATRR